MNDTEIETRVLALNPDVPIDVISELLVAVTFFKERAIEIEKILKDRMFEWIVVNDQPIRIGEWVHFVGPEKKPPKCIDVPGAAEALLDKVRGDWGAMCEHFASSPLKYGAFKATMGEEAFARFFRTEIADELHAEPVAVAEKKLRKMNTAFLK